MLSDRSVEILEAAVKEFIRTGEPVSSSLLFRRYHFGIKPAMIRSELQELTDQGFLEQAYHSAGRMPSDKGYEFFVERVQTERAPSVADRQFNGCFRHARWLELVHALSEHFGILSVLDDLGDEMIYKEGLDNLIEHLDWNYPKEIKEAIRDFESLEERLKDSEEVFRNLEDVAVFIGRRSPITKSKQLAVVAGEYSHEGNNILLFAIGPKRMDYQKVIGIFRHF